MADSSPPPTVGDLPSKDDTSPAPILSSTGNPSDGTATSDPGDTSITTTAGEPVKTADDGADVAEGQKNAEEDRIILGPSTLNPETGKRVYSQDFLLLFQQLPNCREKPEGLLEIDDIIPGSGKQLNKSGRVGASAGGGRGRGGPTSSSSWKNRSQGAGGRGGKTPLHGSGNGPKGWREGASGGSTAPVAPLVSASENKNVWQRPKKAEGNERIFKDIQGILNKLTLEKFQPLSEQLIGLLGQVTDVNMLDQVINQIFDKALSEPQFSKMYAELCLKVQPVCPEFEENGKKQNFRRLLLNRCQKEFEKKTQVDDAEKLSAEEKEAKEVKAKTRMFGNIIFIGELFKLKMLTDKIMHGCVIVTLLPPIGQGQPSQEDLEALCKLMSTVGRQLEAKTKGKPDSPMEQYFRRLADIAVDKSYPSRIRFMLNDLIDMRKNGWVGLGTDDTPKTIEEVHKSLAKEEAARAGRGVATAPASRSSAPPASAPRSGVPGPSSRSGSSTGVASSSGNSSKGNTDGWELVSGGKGSRNNKSTRGSAGPSQGKGQSEGDSRNRQSGRGGRANTRGAEPASRGARGGYSGSAHRGGSRGGGTTGERSKKAKEVPEAAPINYFSLLSSDGEGKEKSEVPEPKSVRPSADVYVPSHRRRQQDEKQARNTTELAAPVASAAVLSEEEQKKLDTATEMLLEEFILNYDDQEAGECLKDLKAPHYHYKVVSKALAMAMERKDEERKLFAKLLFQLHSEQNLISSDDVAKGFNDVLQTVEEADIDSPKASSHLGNLIGQAVLDEILPLSFLGRALDHLIPSGKALKIASEAFRVLANRTNPEELAIMYKESGLDFMRFLPEENRNLDYLNRYLHEQVQVGVDFLSSASS